jgi:oxygen-independent coproporphyrinogen-3 oxidase
MTDELIHRYAKPVPRYTSYPTAPHFHAGVDSATYAHWLNTVPAEAPLSLYLHIPFCDRLCWFCGCHTKQVLRYDPIAAYLPALAREINTVAGLLGGRGRVSAVHLGGGSPSMLNPADFLNLAAAIRSQFTVSGALEFSIEIDPNDMTEDRCDGFATAGVTRISVGVQDFDPKVQQAINRIQTFDQTRDVVEGMRQRGVTSVNLDVLYGLPHQTLTTIGTTIDQVLALRPDRVALFGYAHVPWMKTHQKMIDETALPGVVERFRQSQAAAAQLIAAGYEPIGIDHFALPGDTLAIAARTGRLRRNFQGYTTDEAPVLIGLGASSIGMLPQGYVQNITATGEYIRRVQAEGLATAKGIAFSAEDRLRGYLIEQLMCNFRISEPDLRRHFGTAADPVIEELRGLLPFDGFVRFDAGTFSVTELGRPFVRSIAAAFDAYLNRGTARHSVAV